MFAGTETFTEDICCATQAFKKSCVEKNIDPKNIENPILKERLEKYIEITHLDTERFFNNYTSSNVIPNNNIAEKDKNFKYYKTISDMLMRNF